MLPSLAKRNPIVAQFSQQSQHSCRRFLFFCGNGGPSSAFCLVVPQPCNAETDSCLQPHKSFHFYRIGTRADANIHKAIACNYLSNNICTVIEEWHHGYFCLGYFFSSTHFDLVSSTARKVWRHCGLFFFCTIVTLMPETASSPFEHWPFSFHW